MSIVKKIIQSNYQLINYISLVAGIVSISFVLFQYLKLDTKYQWILTGIFASLLGGLISVSFSYLLRRKPKAKIFISHSMQDKSLAKKLQYDLKEFGFQTYTDEDVVLVGDKMEDTVKKTINESDFVILMLSNNSINSDWVQKELDYSLKNNKIIFPVLIENTKVPEILSEIKYADFTSNYKDAFTELVKSLKLKSRKDA